MTDLSERLEQDLAPAWRPDQEDADILIGQVISIEMGSSEYGSYPLLVVRQEDGTEKAVHAFHTVLRNELVKTRPNVGETIGIKYMGKQKAAEGSKYGSYIGYRVRVDRPLGAEFNWDKVDTEDEVHPFTDTQEPVTVPAGAGDDDIPF